MKTGSRSYAEEEKRELMEYGAKDHRGAGGRTGQSVMIRPPWGQG